MKFSDLKTVITAQWAVEGGNKIAYLVLGKPGGGKSALAFNIVKSLGGNPDNTVVFTPSLRDPVDVLGTPNNRDEMGGVAAFTQWVPPMEFYKLRHVEGDTSPKFLIVEE